MFDAQRSHGAGLDSMYADALQWLDRFYRHLAMERRVSPCTVSSYRVDLTALVAFCDRNGLADWPAVQVSQVRMFAARLHALGLSPSSIQRRLSAVRTFMKYLIREG